MIDSALSTADGVVEVLLYVDADDPELKQYPAWWMIGDSVGLGPAYQKLWMSRKSDIVMMCADDIVFRTKGWDTRVKETMPKDLIGVVSCNELPKGKREHGHPFIGRKFIEGMGYICHPKLKHSCVDTWVRNIAEQIGRFYYLDDVITEHVHPKYGKGELDDTYRSNTREIREEDGAVYRHSHAEMKTVIEKLNAKMVHRV